MDHFRHDGHPKNEILEEKEKKEEAKTMMGRRIRKEFNRRERKRRDLVLEGAEERCVSVCVCVRKEERRIVSRRWGLKYRAKKRRNRVREAAETEMQATFIKGTRN